MFWNFHFPKQWLRWTGTLQGTAELRSCNKCFPDYADRSFHGSFRFRGREKAHQNWRKCGAIFRAGAVYLLDLAHWAYWALYQRERSSSSSGPYDWCNSTGASCRPVFVRNPPEAECGANPHSPIGYKYNKTGHNWVVTAQSDKILIFPKFSGRDQIVAILEARVGKGNGTFYPFPG